MRKIATAIACLLGSSIGTREFPDSASSQVSSGAQSTVEARGHASPLHRFASFLLAAHAEHAFRGYAPANQHLLPHRGAHPVTMAGFGADLEKPKKSSKENAKTGGKAQKKKAKRKKVKDEPLPRQQWEKYLEIRVGGEKRTSVWARENEDDEWMQVGWVAVKGGTPEQALCSQLSLIRKHAGLIDLRLKINTDKIAFAVGGPDSKPISDVVKPVQVIDLEQEMPADGTCGFVGCEDKLKNLYLPNGGEDVVQEKIENGGKLSKGWGKLGPKAAGPGDAAAG